jgi:hypothetical protein
MINKYSFDRDGRVITLVPLTLKKIDDEQQKLKKGRWIKRRACIP